MDAFLRRTEVERATGLSRSEIYRRVRVGEFPKPVSIGHRAVAWKQSAIEAWQDECVAVDWNPHRLSLNDRESRRSELEKA